MMARMLNPIHSDHHGSPLTPNFFVIDWHRRPSRGVFC